jgi:hypothetical protein
VRIKTYLEIAKDGTQRAIGRDFINLTDEQFDTWDFEMDQTRKIMGTDSDWRGKPCVRYQHFVISPDPRDKVDLDTLSKLTVEWAQEMFGKGDGSDGRLGNYEVAIVYHDDNTDHIPHAHIIVNNSNLGEGYSRLQISNQQNKSLLPNRVQEISKKYGLRYFDNDEKQARAKEKIKKGDRVSKAERKVIFADKFSWKASMRNKVVLAKTSSRDRFEFIDALSALGITAEERVRFTLKPTDATMDAKALANELTQLANAVDGDISYSLHEKGVYAWFGLERLEADFDTLPEDLYIRVNCKGKVHSTFQELAETSGFTVEIDSHDWLYTDVRNPKRWNASGYRLGKDYTASAVSAAMKQTRLLQEEAAIAHLRDVLLKYQDGFEVVATDIDKDVTLEDASRVMQFNQEYGVRCFGDYDLLLQQYQKDLKRTILKDSRAKVEAKIADVKAVRDIAHKGKFFLNEEERKDGLPLYLERKLKEQQAKTERTAKKGSGYFDKNKAATSQTSGSHAQTQRQTQQPRQSRSKTR